MAMFPVPFSDSGPLCALHANSFRYSGLDLSGEFARGAQALAEFVESSFGRHHMSTAMSEGRPVRWGGSMR
ncbi:Uncharacterised protein [Mycobacteroides abscessus subsp. abscessus]|nr:Uncharacterised protein [Mycobacteroides abscessus subsp. abscessus]